MKTALVHNSEIHNVLDNIVFYNSAKLPFVTIRKDKVLACCLDKEGKERWTDLTNVLIQHWLAYYKALNKNTKEVL